MCPHADITARCHSNGGRNAYAKRKHIRRPVGKKLFPGRGGRDALESPIQKAVKGKAGWAFGGTGADAATRFGGWRRDTFSVTPELFEILRPDCAMTDEEREKCLEDIRNKLKRGKKLSPEEMRFLQTVAPELYQQVARVQSMRESMEKRLEQSKSKEGAMNAYVQMTAMVGDKDPMKEFILAAYKDAMKEFKKSDEYQALPDTKEDTKEKSGERHPI